MSHRPSVSAAPASRGRPKVRRAAGLAAAAVTAAGLALSMVQLPASGAGVVAPAVLTGSDLDDLRLLGDTPLAKSDVDLRGSVLPSLGQQKAVEALGADVRWNDFGTPASLLPRSGSLGAASTDPAKAPASARNWLRAHSAAFGLSASEVDALKLVENQELAQSDARAVLFRQKFGSLTPAIGGMVTVGVGNGQIAYVSSSLVKNTKAAPEPVLTPQLGWLTAAQKIGASWLGLSSAPDMADITDAVVGKASEGGWTTLSVKNFAQSQQARVRALALADGTVRPVIEANVVNVEGGMSAAYTTMVDAVTGKIWWRQSQVEQAVDTSEGATTGIGMPVMEDNPSKAQFQGEITAATCGPKHKFMITDDDTRQIVVSATALQPENDIVVKIWHGADLLSSGDLGTSPEVATATADPFAQGTYSAQVCPFDDPTAPFVPPGNYVGNVSLSSSESTAPDAGLPFPPRWRYFPTNPTPKFTKDHTPKNDVVGCWVTELDQEPVEGCTEPTGTIRNLGSRSPWDINPNSELPSFTTFGNNVSDREAWFSPLTPGGFFQSVVAPDRKYSSKFTDEWNNSKCSLDNFHPGGNDVLYAATNLFVSHNRMHDFSYFLGFTEKNYNLQQNNFGNGGTSGDPEIGNVQAGAATGGAAGQYLGRDNANQITLQDGVPGVTNQYLFQPIAGAFYAPCTDGDLDMGIVGHEYTHAITNRMVGGPDEGLTSEQGGSMGESWGDLVAGEYQFSHGYKNGGNIWAVGLYATGNKQVAIRDYAINHNPLNYGEFGFDTTGPEVHADGEIWNATMWRVRQALVEKFNKKGFSYSNEKLQLRCAKGAPNKGPEISDRCPGNRRWIQLMFDSYLLQQGATSMLDARDAFIAADQLRYRGDNAKTLWKAFALSGMGKGASTPNADSSEPTPSFAVPGDNTGVTFRPTLPNGDLAHGKVYIGTYEARATPVADTLGKSKLDPTIPMTSGRYRGVFQSPKTGLTRFTVKVDGNQVTKRIPVSTNFAGKQNGAEVVDATEGSRNADFLIDSTEATNWGGVTEGNVDETNPSVTVDLAGGKQTIRRVVVSAMLRPAKGSDLPFLGAIDEDPDSGSRFTALRQFEIQVCASACESEDSWDTAYTSKGNAFPGKRPRPVAPNLTFRSFTFDPVKAQQVRLVVLENQCTGYAGYAGEQDTDPSNQTDCRTESDRGTIVHAAELEVFGR